MRWFEVLGTLLKCIKNDTGQKVEKRIKELTETNELLKQYQRAIENLPFGLVIHFKGLVTFSNAAAAQIFGTSNPAELIGKPLMDFLHPDFAEKAQARIDKVTSLERIEPLTEQKIITLDNRILDIEVSSIPFVFQGKRAVLGVFRDITERKQAEEIINKLAFQDPLTNLPNRRFFTEYLTSAIDKASSTNQLLGIMFFDIDNLKQLNDSLGHSVGDEVIVAFSERVKKLVSSDNILCRWGGDEFTLVVSGIKNVRDITKVAQSIVDCFSQPFEIHDNELYLTTSIGVAVYPLDGEDVETIVKNADTAMYKAKELGGNSYQLYTSTLNKDTLQRVTLGNNLRKALRNNEFIIYYQPIIDIETGLVTGLEALIRWEDPERGLIPPLEFIPIAEETGIIIPLGEWVLRNACMQFKKWQEVGYKFEYMAVNLSARQFMQPNLAERISMLIRETGMDPTALRLEITESTTIRDIEFTIATLERLTAMGIKIIIDDFGTGYTSLSYLKRFPIQALKIDRSFVRDMVTNCEDRAIVSATVSLAKGLNLGIIAEGVEEPKQLELLEYMGCPKVQGFLFSPPMPVDRLDKELSRINSVFSEIAASKSVSE